MPFCRVFPSQCSHCCIAHAWLIVLISDVRFLCCSEKLNTCVSCCGISLLLDLKINISFEMQILACTKDFEKVYSRAFCYSPLAEEHVVCVLGLNRGLWRYCRHLWCRAVRSGEILSESEHLIFFFFQAFSWPPLQKTAFCIIIASQNNE